MKDFKAIVSEHLTKQHSEKRFVVVGKNGEVLDSNDGQGFISENKAIVAYSKKHGIKLEKDLDRIEDKAYRRARKMLKK